MIRWYIWSLSSAPHWSLWKDLFQNPHSTKDNKVGVGVGVGGMGLGVGYSLRFVSN